MKGIQINNYFNNHISLNGKKNKNHEPIELYESGRPQPLVFNRNLDQDLPQQIVQSQANTPQIKPFKKDGLSARKKRTNTAVVPSNNKQKQIRKSKQKKASSLQHCRRVQSVQKYNQKDTFQQQLLNKNVGKISRKTKVPSNSNHNDKHPTPGIKRSKSAIIKNTQSKNLGAKDKSKQFFKQPKNNILYSADSTMKSTKKIIKKQTQNLLDKKQRTQKGECRTARVHSNMVKQRKNKDKTLSDLQRSTEKIDAKTSRFQTQKKYINIPTTRSFLTSAKQSKPVSARQKKGSKKLFDNKQKDYLKTQEEPKFYKKLQNLIGNSDDEQESTEVKQAMNQLEQVLQNMSSKKTLAKELKRFTNKLKQIPKSQNQVQDDSLSQQQQSNSEAFKRIKNFNRFQVKNSQNKHKNLQIRILPKQKLSSRIPSQKSNKKLHNKKKNLQDPNKNIKKGHVTQIKPFSKRAQKNQKSSDQPSAQRNWPFDNTQSQQSRYINSKTNSQFFDSTNNNNTSHPNLQNSSPHHIMYDDQINNSSHQQQQQQILDENNRKYMQFLGNLQSQNKKNQQQRKKSKQSQLQPRKYEQESHSYQNQKSQDFIQDINNYLNNKQIVHQNKMYSSENPKDARVQFLNPILERKRVQNNFTNQEKQSNKNLSDNEQQSDKDSDHVGNKIIEIQRLKQFQKHSDKWMQKISGKQQNTKKRSLTIQLNTQLANIDKNKALNQRNKSPSPLSSPKYDDRYPNLINMKSPKYSDVQITNILAVKEKCLASKHQKMNELIQKMYEKQLVSPKSYQYSVYQLKKQFQEQSDGFDGFKEQASQILKQINRDKNDIKGIEQLIRQQKWQQAKKLMKMDNRNGSVFSGFKKNVKQKVYQQQYQGWQRVQVQVQAQTERKIEKQNASPSKRLNIQVVQRNISIIIQPSRQKPLQLAEVRMQTQPQQVQTVRLQIQPLVVWQQLRYIQPLVVQQQLRQNSVSQERVIYSTLPQKAHLIRQRNDIDFSQSDSNRSENPDLISRKLDFEFDQKFRLKSNDFESPDQEQSMKILQEQLKQYLRVQKEHHTEQQQFENYVYYQNQQNEEKQTDENSASHKSGRMSQGLREEGMIRLIQVKQGDQSKENDDLDGHDLSHQINSSDQSLHDEVNGCVRKTSVQIITKHVKSNVSSLSNQKTICIDQQDCSKQSQSQEKYSSCQMSEQMQGQIPGSIPITTIEEAGLESHSSPLKASQQLEDSFEDSNSILQLQVRKGFESNLFFIKEYCISLCQYIRDNEQFKSQFRQNISESLQFNTEDLLKTYRRTSNKQYDNSYDSSIKDLDYKSEFRRPNQKAVSIDLADQFNKTYAPLKFYNMDLTNKRRAKFAMEKQAEVFFLSGILEVLNESLDFERPGSIFGKPLPWASNQKYLKNMKYLKCQKKKKVDDDCQDSAQTYDFIFGVAIARIIQWGSCLCGFLPDTAQLQNTQIDEDYVVHIRETRMAFLLQKMLAQQQATINNSELQQTEIMLYLGKQIMQQLIKQASQEVQSLNKHSPHQF